MRLLPVGWPILSVILTLAACHDGRAADEEVPTAADPCPAAVTTADMVRCLADSLAKADTALARDAARAREVAQPAAAFDSAQAAWVRYRDAECAAEASRYAGGSAGPLAQTSCRLALTQERTQRIRNAFLEP